jgi:hypothetical protein
LPLSIGPDISVTTAQSERERESYMSELGIGSIDIAEKCIIPCQFVQDISKDVTTLRRIVYEGNGESLVSRVSKIETTLRALVWISGATFVMGLGVVGTVSGALILGYLHLPH